MISLSRNFPITKLLFATIFCIVTLVPSTDACQQVHLKSLRRLTTNVTPKSASTTLFSGVSSGGFGFGSSGQDGQPQNPSQISAMIGVGTLFQYKLDGVAFNVFNQTVEIPPNSLKFPCFNEQILSLQLTDITKPNDIEETVYQSLNQVKCNQLQRGQNTISVSLYPDGHFVDTVSNVTVLKTNTAFTFGKFTSKREENPLYIYEFVFEVSRYCTDYAWNAAQLMQNTQIASSRWESRVLDEDYVKAYMRNQETVFFLPNFIRQDTQVNANSSVIFSDTFDEKLLESKYNMVPSSVPKNKRNSWGQGQGVSSNLQAGGQQDSGKDMTMWYGLIAFLGILLIVNAMLIMNTAATPASAP